MQNLMDELQIKARNYDSDKFSIQSSLFLSLFEPSCTLRRARNSRAAASDPASRIIQFIHKMNFMIWIPIFGV